MIGTHNSMTYLKPKKWYMYPFNFIAKCQSVDIKKQYELGARIFDIRISYDKDDNPEFRHGKIAYKGDVHKVLEYLNTIPNIKVRLILEIDKSDFGKEILFISNYYRFKEKYANISFYEGRRKYDWKQIIDLPTLDLIQAVGSMQGSKLNAVWPWLYAKRNNIKNLKKYYNKPYLLIDFINENGATHFPYL